VTGASGQGRPGPSTRDLDDLVGGLDLETKVRLLSHIGARGYLRAGTEPAWWFGQGLGYTTWAWVAIAAEGATATVRVRNTGDRPGKEVVRVYAARPASAVDRPARWLAGFAVARADPGEAVDVPVRIGPEAFRHWDADAHTWAVEPGEVVLSAGRSAGDLRVHASVTLAGDRA
jgi:beta-glucosidase